MYISVFIYIALLALVAWIGWKKTHTLDDHILAGRSMPVWLAAFTLAATLVGTGVTLGVGELAYEYGVSAMLYPVILGVALAASIVATAGAFRKSGAATIPELLARTYGKKVQALSAGASALKWMGPTAAQYLAVGYIIHAATGLDPAIAIIVGAILIVAYVILGGAWAIAYTDSLQFVMVYVGFTFLFFSGVSDSGGVSTLLEKLDPRYSSWSGVGLFTLTAWIGSIVALSFADQAWLQRSAMVKTPKDAVVSGLIAAAMVLPIGYFTVYAGLLAAVQSPGLDPKTAVPNLIFASFSPQVAALFVTAILAAAMSCVDSWLHSSATLVTRDIYMEFIHPNATENEQKKVMNLVTAAMGLGAVALALIWKGAIISLVFLTWVWGSGIYIGPLLLVWYSSKRISPGAAFFVIAAAIVAGTALTYYPLFGISPIMTGAIAGYALTAGAYLLSTKAPEQKEEPAE